MFSSDRLPIASINEIAFIRGGEGAPCHLVVKANSKKYQYISGTKNMYEMLISILTEHNKNIKVINL
jgi:hypothetical protein